MVEADIVELRGFDSYRVSLGDEMRGERASLGKSLLDVQRELRIKAAHIDAIESANPDGVPHRGFVTGYVRAYARYLGMDEDAVLRRFCEESGFTPPSAAPLAAGALSAGRAAAPGARRADLDAVIAGSRLAAASRAASVNASFGAVVSGVASLGVLCGLVGGLGYGAWTMLENIQRVDFAPLPQAPEALAAAPEIDMMMRIARAGAVPGPMIDASALAAVYAAQEVGPPPSAPRDGPISALDPESAGVYAAASAPKPEDFVTAALDPAFVVALAATENGEPSAVVSAEPAPDAAPRPPEAEVRGVALVIDSEAWVRVRDGSGRVVHEKLMQAGESWRAPEAAQGFTLRAGNAGGVFLEVDGVRHGPLGRPGGVVSNVLLDASAIRAALPKAVAETPARAEPVSLSAALADR
ncbi:helix-turn-helix domain-containing protein [Rubrimonas cliftonensis]|uniref:Protein RodZ, contains Xre-like HTH and DUF4115 domains n=1 Tax=Rubrimonas cliftonensis TaxID=89524 RepID=A0A1H3W0H0_9RHOB|nr:helix-turn-helix domain-containing protein [Rubrimonas cliftonensis]SDZ80563.1 protein RodZ, contains Xre-like HTH and DUF4115 domains [Rubrimonas cliftonensis]